ncbi:MAG: formimidoylglutamate deiminase [Acidimicrobiia bacterium]|nr:MAG: formimidoylglutamate deiminase [Acidimicrobiia bacterium]
MERWFAERAWLGGPNLTENVVLTVGRGRITSIARAQSHSSADHKLDGIVIPGLVSAHSHAFHRALRGHTSDGTGDFWSWRTPMYKVANRLNPESYRELAIAVFSEMLEAGITTVGEFHYLHHDEDGQPYADPNAMGRALIEAAVHVGIRVTLIDAAYLMSNVAGSPVTPQQRRFSDGTIDAWSERVRDLNREFSGEPAVRIGVAAHSVRGVAATDLGDVARTARELNVPLHIHVSEQIAENEACKAAHGVTPARLLETVGFLGPSTTLVHATHLTPDDIDIIAATGTGVCFCPTTEADLGDGIGPAAELVEAGVHLSLGSDSNAIIDILDEARRVEYHDRLRLHSRGIHRPEDMLESATSGGAEALGWSGGGRIAENAPADFIAIDPTSSELAGTDLSTVAGLAMASTRASVTDVVVGGRRVVASGRLLAAPTALERASTLAAMAKTGEQS